MKTENVLEEKHEIKKQNNVIPVSVLFAAWILFFVCLMVITIPYHPFIYRFISYKAGSDVVETPIYYYCSLVRYLLRSNNPLGLITTIFCVINILYVIFLCLYKKKRDTNL